MQLNNQFKILIIMVSAFLVLGCSSPKIPGFINRTAMAVVTQVYDHQEAVAVDVVVLPDHSGIVDGPIQGLAVPTELQPIHIGDRVVIEILYHIDQSEQKDPSCGLPFTARIISKK